MEARSGNELDRRWLFWNDVVPRLFTFPPTSSCLMSLRIPNCLRNHFFVRGLRGGFKLPSLSMSFIDGTFELFFCFSAISSLFKSSDCKSNFGGLFFFALIFILKRKARDIFVLAIFKHFYLNHEQSLYLAWADPGFFLGEGALVSCSTSTPKQPHVFFFSRIPVVLENHRSSCGGGAHPLHPPSRSAPAWCNGIVFIKTKTV